MDEYNGSEKRRHKRLDAHFVVSYRATDPISDFDLSQTKDISQGGVFITTSKKFEKGAGLAMIIRIPFAPYKIELIGQVVGSEGKGSNYQTHVMFKDADQDFIKNIESFIEEQLKRKGD